MKPAANSSRRSFQLNRMQLMEGVFIDTIPKHLAEAVLSDVKIAEKQNNFIYLRSYDSAFFRPYRGFVDQASR